MKPGRGWDIRLDRMTPNRRAAAVVLHRVAKRRGVKRPKRQRRVWDRLKLYYGIYRGKGLTPIDALRRAVRLSR
jgi:hypothetical protein